jgi:insulysin
VRLFSSYSFGLCSSFAQVAMRFIVQSEVADPIHLDGRIEAFLTNLRVLLAETLSDEEFEANRGAVREKLCESYKNLNEETGALWGKVQDGSMDFGKKWREAEVVATLTRQDVLLFFDQYLGLESPHRRKISLQVNKGFFVFFYSFQ